MPLSKERDRLRKKKIQPIPKSENSTDSNLETTKTEMQEVETMSDICPTCHQPFDGVQDLKIERLKHETAIKEKDAQVKDLQDALKGSLENKGWQTLAEVVEHCEGGKCLEHKQAWDGIWAKKKAGMTPEEIRELMKAHKIYEAPDTISIEMPAGV